MTLKKDEKDELMEFLKEEKELEPKVMTIIYDKTQYSVRIPKKFVRMFNLKGGEEFEFKAIKEGDKFILIGRMKT